jgi:pimeloyl-ACP methyl ester carboxylesterase/ribosomal protein S18 acetylase RimI-like enzyme
MKFTVRELATGDVGALQQFFAAVPAEDRTFFKVDVTDPAIAQEWVRGDRSLRRLVTGGDGAILAVGALQPRVGRSSHVAELVIVVAARARRLGLGTMLARQLLIAALDNGARKVIVEVAADNVGPIELFRGLGFEPEALLRDAAQPRGRAARHRRARAPRRRELVGAADGRRRRAERMTRARERSVRLDGIRIHVREVGDGPPVLLINGLGAHTAMWATTERMLAGFRLISFDAPGTGRSETPLLPVGVSRLARLSALVLDDSGVERADVLGYSMGGIVGQQLAVDAPGRVRRLVLVATTCGLGAVASNPVTMLNIATPLRYLSPRLYRLTIGNLAGGRARSDPAWVRSQEALRLRHSPSIRGYLGQVLSLSPWTSLPMLSRIEHPTLVVGGGGDPLSPAANALILGHALPNARVFVAPGEGHLMLMDADSAVHAPIRDFLAARRLKDAPRIDPGTVSDAIAGAGRQSQPWGIVGAIKRRRFLALSSTSTPRRR